MFESNGDIVLFWNLMTDKFALVPTSTTFILVGLIGCSCFVVFRDFYWCGKSDIFEMVYALYINENENN